MYMQGFEKKKEHTRLPHKVNILSMLPHFVVFVVKVNFFLNFILTNFWDLAASSGENAN